MQKALIFPPKLVDLQNYYYFEQGFSNEELDKIYKDVAFIPFQKAKNENNLRGFPFDLDLKFLVRSHFSQFHT